MDAAHRFFPLPSYPVFGADVGECSRHIPARASWNIHLPILSRKPTSIRKGYLAKIKNTKRSLAFAAVTNSNSLTQLAVTLPSRWTRCFSFFFFLTLLMREKLFFGQQCNCNSPDMRVAFVRLQHCCSIIAVLLHSLRLCRMFAACLPWLVIAGLHDRDVNGDWRSFPFSSSFLHHLFDIFSISYSSVLILASFSLSIVQDLSISDRLLAYTHARFPFWYAGYSYLGILHAQCRTCNRLPRLASKSQILRNK